MIIHNCSQNTKEWGNLHIGLPTASAFNKIITSKGLRSESLLPYADILAYQIYNDSFDVDFGGTKWTARGHELEPDAIIEYDLQNDCILTQPGFITNDDKSFGCSPDSLIDKDGLLEVKCLNTSSCIELIKNEKKGVLKCPSDKYAQVQGQLMITEREYCDLFFYHPVLPGVSIRILPDLDFHEKLKIEIAKTIYERDLTLEILRAA